LVKTGVGTLDLSGADTLTGGLTINGGTLTLDFTTGTTTVLGSQALTLSGGTLTVLGANPGPSSQTLGAVANSSGANTISVAPTSGGSNPTLTLGALANTLGATLQFVGPATINSSGNVTATATITTTTVGAGQVGLFTANSGTAYATVGSYDWASTDTTAGGAGTSPYTIIGGSQVSGFYTALASGNVGASSVNYDVTGATAGSSSSSTYNGDTLRFNTAVATTFTVSTSKNWGCAGMLVTPKVGANNVTFGGTGTGLGLGNGQANPMTIVQNNTLGELIFNSSSVMIRGTGTYIQSGPGTVFAKSTSGNLYTGATYVNGGVLEITANSQLGGTAASSVNLNGGTLLGDYSGNLDNGTTAHLVALGNNGGGLAAVNTFTFTVDGVVSGATGTGALIIGLPTTGGKVLGTGASTANTTEVDATGTVVLNNTGNTYTGSTILDSGILQLTVNNLAVLGTGGLTLNGGTFQWSGQTTDISSRTVTVGSGGGTLDVNGSTVTLANAIGNSGSGALTVANSGSAGAALLLNGGSSHTGGTTVSSGATLGGTGTVAGNVTWANGSSAKLTPGSPMTVSGTAAFNGTGSGNTITINASGLTASGSPYTLLTAGSVTGTVNPTPGGVGVIASGYIGVVSISGGNKVILTVTSSGTAATWADSSLDQNWSEAGNWTPAVPHLAGDTATFNSAGGSAVTLDAGETVGGITFNNASSDVISGGNTLTLDNSGSGAIVTVSAGTANAITTSVALNDNAAIIANSGQSLTLGGTVANAPSVTKTLTISGGGTAILSQANTYGPAATYLGTTLGGATVQVGNNTALGSGDVSVTSSSTLQSGAAGLSVANNIAVASLQTATVDNNGNNLALGGVISGGGSVTASGTGTLTLSGASTYSGGTTLAASSQLNINYGGSSSANSAIGTGALTIGGGIIDNTSAGDVTLSPAIAENWSGDFVYAGSVHNLNLGTGAVTLGATRQVTVSANTLTVGGAIGGASYGLTKAGAGTLVLSGANTFGGAMVISGGSLKLGNSLALQGSTLNYSSGTLDFGSLTAATLGGLSGAQDLTLANTTPAAVALTVGGNNASTSYSGNLSGPGSLTMAGTGTLTLGNANYTGSTTVSSSGTVTINGGSFGSSSSTINVATTGGGTATLNYSGSGTVTANTVGVGNVSSGASGSSMTITGGAWANFTTLNLGAAGNYFGNFTINTTGTVGLGAVTAYKDENANGPDGTAAGLVISAGTVTASSLIVQGGGSSGAATVNMRGGSLKISGSSGAFEMGNGASTRGGWLEMTGGTLTYLGTDGLLMGNVATTATGATVSGGTAYLTGITLNPFGGTASSLTVSNGATLYLGSVGLVINQPSGTVLATLGNGGATVGALATWSSSAPITLTGTTTFQAADAATPANPWNITLNGVLSGNGGLTKTGNGTLTLSTANIYTGPTAVSNGTLFVNGSIAAGAVTVTNAALAGTGTIGGATTLQPFSILAAGSGGVGTLSFGGALTLDALSTNDFSVTPVGGALNKVAVAGALTPNGSVIKITSGTALHRGTYTLFTYGTVSGTFDATPAFDVAPLQTASIVDDAAGHISLVVPDSAPVVANIVTNNVTTGLSWKIAISDLKAAAGWSDPDGDAVALSSVALLSFNGASVTSDGTYVYYNGPVTAEDHFAYTVTDGTLTTSGTVYLEAVAGAGGSIQNTTADDNGHPTFSGSGIPGYQYGVESSTVGVSGPWINAGTVTVGSNGSWSFTDVGQVNPPLIFYRLYYPYSANNPAQ
jgi:autotransporter-associated beta strand protein